MKITVNAEGSPLEIAQQLHAHSAVYAQYAGVPGGPAPASPPPAGEVEAPGKRGRPKKEEKAAETFDLGFGADAGLGEPAAEAPKPKTLDDVIKALQAYAAKHGRDKTVKILSKFSVNSVKDLKPEQFADVLALAEV